MLELQTEISNLRNELKRMKGKNHELKHTLNKLQDDYKAIEIYMMDFMSSHKGSGNDEKHENESSKEKRRRSESDISNLLASIKDDNRANHSKSLKRSRSLMEMEGKIEERSEKTRKYSPSRIVDSPPRNVDDQVEATMRKARVSVRTRSEANMVSGVI